MRGYLYILVALLVVFQPAGCSSKSAGKDGQMTVSVTTKKDHKYSNNLINESSPYLLQHAHNPVNWFPWSDEALKKAKDENKPIFLSIGYSACHWCHVMEHESFENKEIADLLNENFISIKVDREERPDLDQIYMTATQAMTGGGGWPMSVFLTPDLKPFFAGTYFPPDDRYGRRGFKSLITEIAKGWHENNQRIENYAVNFVTRLKSTLQSSKNEVVLSRSIVEKAASGLIKNDDKKNGGFGSAPKFPHPNELSFLLKIYAADKDPAILEAVEHSLMAMAQGGIYDQLGGGFHRYATDAAWLVPHFEKMLYDNALLAVTYSEAYQLTGKELYRTVVRETLDFMLREMYSEKSGFYSSLDADSEGEEGKFYVWRKDEVDRLLEKQSDTFSIYYNVTTRGNFEHNSNILNINDISKRFRANLKTESEAFAALIEKSRKTLFDSRSKRVRPFTDDKTLVSWNGMAISGLCHGYQITYDERYKESAVRTAKFILSTMYRDKQLFHSYRVGAVSEGPFLEDYAFFIQSLIDLYEITYDFKWINHATELAVGALKFFSDESGNLYLSPAGLDNHYIRPKDISDGALPAAGSILIQSLLKLADITGRDEFQAGAEKSLSALSGDMATNHRSMISAVTAFNYLTSDKIELVLVGEKGADKFLGEIYRRYFSNRVIVVSKDGDEDIPLFKGRQTSGKATAYVCKNSVCQLPVNDVSEFIRQLDEL